MKKLKTVKLNTNRAGCDVALNKNKNLKDITFCYLNFQMVFSAEDFFLAIVEDYLDSDGFHF